MKRLLALILCVGLILSLSGCANVEAKSNAQVMDFAVRLFQNSEESGKNTLISPFSVLCALAMTANGADGETLSQMEQTLGMSSDELNNYLNTYRKSIAQGEKRKLSIANSIWFKDDPDFTTNNDFLRECTDYYGADIYKKSFDKSTLDEINAWVKEKTDGMIDKILEDISEEAVMYLINALAFDAEWEEIYEDEQLSDYIFFKDDETRQPVVMMYNIEDIYLKDENAKGFIKKFYGGEYAFAALLPDKGVSVSDYVKSLTGEKLSNILANQEETSVYTLTPKFKNECNYEMSDILKKMGMTDAFEVGKADFSKLGNSEKGNIFINRVIHKTYIEVSEKGAKAGAATEVESTYGGLGPEYKEEVILNRPFVYMIIDTNTNFPLFIGTVAEV